MAGSEAGHAGAFAEAPSRLTCGNGFVIGEEGGDMRLLAFTLLAIAAGMGIQWSFGQLPHTVSNAMHGIGMDMAWFLLLPVIATAGLTYAMRISNLGHVIALAVFSPFVSWVLGFLIAVFVFDQQAYI